MVECSYAVPDSIQVSPENPPAGEEFEVRGVAAFDTSACWYLCVPPLSNTPYPYYARVYIEDQLVWEDRGWLACPLDTQDEWIVKVRAPDQPGKYRVCFRTEDDDEAGREGSCTYIDVVEPPPPEESNMERLAIKTEPPGASVYINRKLVGYTESNRYLYVDLYTCFDYELYIVKSGYYPHLQTIHPDKPGETEYLEIPLQPLPEEERKEEKPPGITDYIKYSVIAALAGVGLAVFIKKTETGRRFYERAMAGVSGVRERIARLRR